MICVKAREAKNIGSPDIGDIVPDHHHHHHHTSCPDSPLSSADPVPDQLDQLSRKPHKDCFLRPQVSDGEHANQSYTLSKLKLLIPDQLGEDDGLEDGGENAHVADEEPDHHGGEAQNEGEVDKEAG